MGFFSRSVKYFMANNHGKGWYGRHVHAKNIASTTSVAKALATAVVNATDPQAPASPPVALGTPASVGTPGTGIAAPQTTQTTQTTQAAQAAQTTALIPGSFAYMQQALKRKNKIFSASGLASLHPVSLLGSANGKTTLGG